MLSSELFKEKFVEVVQDALSRREEVVLPDFGVLRVEKNPVRYRRMNMGVL